MKNRIRGGEHMELAMIVIGAAASAWSLMRLIAALDALKKNEPQSSGNYSGTRCGW